MNIEQLDAVEIAETICSSPSESMTDSWSICSRMTDIAKRLIAADRHEDVFVIARVVASRCRNDSWISGSASDLIQWSFSNNHPAELGRVQLAMELSERGAFALALDLDNRTTDPARPFIISAMMPKSGGTYIGSIMHGKVGYSNEILRYAFGDVNVNFLSECRVRYLAKLGGVFNHMHLYPCTWNKDVILRTDVPLWVHCRDPRDCHLSLVNMLRYEFTKGNYGLRRDAGLDDSVSLDTVSDSELGERLYSHFERNCNWLEQWIGFSYPRKLVTYHADLARDEKAFFAKVKSAFGINVDGIIDLDGSRDREKTRFHVGTNGRWRTEFDSSLRSRMADRFRASRLASLFDE